VAQTQLSRFEFPSAEIWKDPYPFYAALRAEAPVFKVAGHDDYIISRHEDVLWALKHPELFSSRRKPRAVLDPDVAAVAARGLPRVATLMNADDPDHKTYRTLAAAAFTPRRLKTYQGFIADIVSALLDDFIPAGRVEFVSQFANLVPMLVICDLLGLPRSMAVDFKRWSDMVGELRSDYISKERALECHEALLAYESYLQAHIEGRWAEPGDDVLSEIVNTPITTAEGPLEHADLAHLVDIAQSLVTAGNETTANLLANGMYQLLHHPEQLQMVMDRRELIPPMIEETLRLQTSAQYSTRIAVSDTVLHGVRIPEGARVLLMRAAANRDDDVFALPDQFTVERSNVHHHLGFGHGVHFCIGAPLARLEGRLAFEMLFDRAENFALAGASPPFSHHPLFRWPTRLDVEFNPRHHP
jgi:cytochrome P450